jgi:hypothetical protein
VGDGTKISFWHDLWVRNMTLKTAFPVLFGIAIAKDASIVNNLEFLGGSNQWNVNFTREVHDWKVNVLASFFQMLHSSIVRRGGEDKPWWVPSKKGIFKVKTFFSLIDLYYRCSLSLEVCMTDPSPLKGGLLFVIGSSW